MEQMELDLAATAAGCGWTGRADYAERRAARIERLEDRAERHGEASTAAYRRAHAAVEGIPFGQPNIRGCLTPAYKRHETAMREMIRESGKAEEAKRQAEAARKNHAISSDDPEALDKLRQKLADHERLQERMKAVNAALRIKDTERSDAALRALGCSEGDITELRTPDFCGRIGYPAFALSNNNATIRSVKERIAQLEKMAAGPAPEGWTFAGGEVICNLEENRVQIKFEEIPDEETRRELKESGFRWSRWNGVWQRQLTQYAIWDAERIVGRPGRGEVEADAVDISAADLIEAQLEEEEEDC